MARILVVDDDPAVREMLTDILSAEGHRIAEAGDGQEALVAIRRAPPDLVVTDLLMPTMGGLKLIGEIQKNHPAVRIIAISGGARGMGMNFLSVARTYGVRTLNKPFHRRELLEAVGQTLSA